MIEILSRRIRITDGAKVRFFKKLVELLPALIDQAHRLASSKELH